MLAVWRHVADARVVEQPVEDFDFRFRDEAVRTTVFQLPQVPFLRGNPAPYSPPRYSICRCARSEILSTAVIAVSIEWSWLLYLCMPLRPTRNRFSNLSKYSRTSSKRS